MAYNAPTAYDLRARYPAFVDMDDSLISYWLAEASENCASFPETVRARAAMSYAAHRMAALGIGAGAIPQGFTSFKSVTFSATVSDAVAGLTGFDATVYGREFVALRRVAFAGPRMAWTPPTAMD